MICSPLEQFSIVTIFPLRIGDLFLSFTNSSLYLLIATGLVSLLFFLVTTEGGRLVPSRWQSVVEMTYQFVGSLVEELLGMLFLGEIFLIVDNDLIPWLGSSQLLEWAQLSPLDWTPWSHLAEGVTPLEAVGGLRCTVHQTCSGSLLLLLQVRLHTTISKFQMPAQGILVCNIFLFVCLFEEEALHASQTCQLQQYQQTAKGNLWDWGIHSTTHNRGSCFFVCVCVCVLGTSLTCQPSLPVAAISADS